jgi:hypothetical protein
MTPAWLARPLEAPLGRPIARPVLVLGVYGLVVVGTLYHVVPFLVWVDRYSDRLGLADVPAVDEMYDDRLAAADLGCFVAATVLLAAAPVVGPGIDGNGLGRVLRLAGTAALLAGAALFAANVAGVVRNHIHGGVRGLLTGAAPDGADDDTDPFDGPEPGD